MPNRNPRNARRWRGRSLRSRRARPEHNPRVICQPGLPGFLARVVEKTVCRWRNAVTDRTHSSLGPCGSLSLPGTICLGAWEGMPASFLVPGDPTVTAAVNLRTPPAPPFLSTGSRPLAVEVVVALALTLRSRLAGAPERWLDWAWAAGAALGVCADWWPDRPIWKLAGLTGLEWAWCREQEEVLWEQALPFLERALPRWLFGVWPPPEAACVHTSPMGKRGGLYLPGRFFEALRSGSLNPDLPRLLAVNTVGLRRELARAGFRS